MYRITIQKSHDPDPDDKGYYSWKDVYEQSLEELDVQAVIAVVNGLGKVSSERLTAAQIRESL